MYRLQLRRSRIEFILLQLVHGAALAGVALSDLGLPLALLLALLVLSHAGLRLRTWYLQPCREILLSGETVLLVLGQERREYLLPQASYLAEFLLQLRFAPLPGDPDRRGYALLLFPDSLDTKQWRRLQRLLRFELRPHASSPGTRD